MSRSSDVTFKKQLERRPTVCIKYHNDQILPLLDTSTYDMVTGWHNVARNRAYIATGRRIDGRTHVQSKLAFTNITKSTLPFTMPVSKTTSITATINGATYTMAHSQGSISNESGNPKVSTKARGGSTANNAKRLLESKQKTFLVEYGICFYRTRWWTAIL